MVRKNLSWGDATFRGLASLVCLVLGMDAVVALQGTARIVWATVFGVLTGVLAATAFTRACPLYQVLGVDRAGLAAAEEWADQA